MDTGRPGGNDRLPDDTDSESSESRGSHGDTEGRNTSEEDGQRTPYEIIQEEKERMDNMIAARIWQMHENIILRYFMGDDWVPHDTDNVGPYEIIQEEKERMYDMIAARLVPLEVDLAGPELRALYDRACEEGYTEVHSTRLVLVGKFGNGKTNLCNSLIGHDFDPEWKITDSVAIHPCVMSGGQEWRKLEAQEDHLSQAVANVMKKLKDESQQEQPKSPSKCSKSQTYLDFLEAMVGHEKRDEEYVKVLAKLFQKKDDHPNITGTREYPQISIWDFGGQAIFYTTQQVFYTRRAIYAMILNLTKPLDSHVEKTTEGLASHCNTEKDFIDYHLESIRAYTRTNLPHSKVGQTPGNRDIKPPVVFIFTHKDSVAEDVKQTFHNNTRAHLKGKVIDWHVIDKYFSVDNTKRNPEDPEVAELRKFIVDLARQQSYMGERIPIKWLQLKSKLQDMRSKGERYCSLQDVIRASGNPPAGTTPEENAISILTFWHLCGDIIYLPVQNLRNFVILDPQWFVDVCKTIITIPQYRDPEVKDEWNKLQETGELRDSLIDFVWKHREEALRYNLIGHKQELLTIMEEFDLILLCQGRGDEEATYFVPSLLTTVSDDCKKLYPPGTTCSKPIFIVFDGKFFPVGLYHQMVIRSMRRYFKVKPAPVYLSCAKFKTSNPRQIFIITKEKFYLKVELVSSVQDEANRFSHGPGVREGLEKDLKEIIDKWAPGIRYKWCLRCSCEGHKEETDEDSFIPITNVSATEYFETGEVVCDDFSPATATIQDIGLADWFVTANPLLQGGSGRSLAQAPKETSEGSSARPVSLRSGDVSRYFNKVVREASASWDNLARQLKLEENEIDVIEEKKSDCDRRCREMLKRWRNDAGDAATLKVLKKALKKIGHRRTADRLDDSSESSESSDG